MTSDEFLAHVEKFKLPWTCEGDHRYWDSEGDLASEWGESLSVELPRAAPALAAAAIRLLRLWGTPFTDVEQEQKLLEGLEPAMAALRAALPEELRP